MSVANPSYTANDVITDVEGRMQVTNSATLYIPWISYAYQKVYQALAGVGQHVQEQLFGNYTTLALQNGVAEYSISTNIPRYSSMIKMEILYGATGDQRVPVEKLRSIAHWRNQANVSTSYRSKDVPLYYILQDILGFIPTPDGGTAYIWFVQRPNQIVAGTDVIDIPYRFVYPIADYVHAKTIQKENEDYSTARLVEANFQAQLEEIADAAASEFSENDGTDAVEIPADSGIYQDPLRY